ncbi:hypothetical protein LOK49_LG08G02954 [Camellia lanceoleosa]|uniref:Uncharacterized protein n=1 Tax=Camellia lanceoleosa TaxID=1840588 RepID=A0ACC0GPH4_9ERIC|nr:hypothetical protein LOK49_LG08G02954 [Camellia lanceoleosa]
MSSPATITELSAATPMLNPINDFFNSDLPQPPLSTVSSLSYTPSLVTSRPCRRLSLLAVTVASARRRRHCPSFSPPLLPPLIVSIIASHHYDPVIFI